ncbi:hypothetical protein [Variovorax sp. DXTD-1]|uniref:LtfC-like domain-containing protein n=1 Tax=Variovorax sp. DXTD-1 TaxID=2495592 RepID=UPI000F870F33|nr:hypothetical protein [Variovorax sp. DXTD-1]RST54100.1 hypothetical protein EJI00_02950 [Variovorax sp. DXTD-1]
MPAAKLKLSIDQGATFTKTVTWKTGKPALPVDLTGCTARMQVRETIQSDDVLLELSTTDGRITLGGTAGTVNLRVEAADTAIIAWKSGVYDLEIQFADGTVRRLLSGSVTVSPEVTR